MARVFISHSSADKDAATTLIDWLKQEGFQEIFLDFDRHHGIPPGDDWERRLYAEIQGATAVILLLTRNWFESKWCFAEFTQARAMGKSVLPVVVTRDGNQFIGDNLQKIDLTKNRDDGLGRLLDRLRDLSLDSPAGFKLPPGRAPYPGMLSFDRDDAAVYFGREPELREIIERLERLRRRGGAQILYLHGESGSGKSSLLKAGLWPHLRHWRDDWLLLPFFRPGPLPLNELRAVFLSGGAPQTLVDAFFNNPAPETSIPLVNSLRDHDRAFQATLLISIDQFEEAFTLPTEADQARLFALLTGLIAPGQRTLIVATLRTADLARAVGKFNASADEHFICPFPLDRLPEIIRKPAGAAGIEVEDSLISAITREAVSPDALPLVAFLLRRLYDRFGTSRRLTLAEYENLSDPKAGLRPLEACVRDAADSAIESLKPSPAESDALREAFVPGLVRINDAGQFVRRPLAASETPPSAVRLIDALVNERLLVRRDDGATEVTHEALFRVWPPLQRWLEEEREFLIGKSRIEGALADYRRAATSRRGDTLLTGLLLTNTEAWLKQHPQRFDKGQRELIETSVHSRETANARGVRIRRVVTTIWVILTLATGVAAVYARYQRNRAVKGELLATRNSERAEKNAQDAAQRQTEAKTNERIANGLYAETLVSEGNALHLAGRRAEARSVYWDAFDQFERFKFNPFHAEAAICVAFGESAPPLITFQGPVSVVSRVAISPDGSTALTGSYDNTLNLWNLKTGEKICTFEGHTAKVTCVAISPDGRVAVSGSEDNTIRVWDIPSRKLTRTFEAHSHATLMSIDPQRGTVEYPIIGVLSVAISPDGRKAISGSGDPTIKLWDLQTSSEILTLEGHESGVTTIAFGPDGNAAVSGSEDQTLKSWDLHTGKATHTFRGHTGEVTSVAISPDGRTALSGSADETVKLWNLETGKEIRTFHGHTGRVASVAISPDGCTALSGSDDKTLKLWDLRTGKVIRTLQGDTFGVACVAISPDGRTAVSASGDEPLKLWDLETDLQFKLNGHAGAVNSVSVSPDGRTALSSSLGTIKLWDLRTGRELRTLRGDGITRVAFSPEGRTAISDSGIEVRTVWDLQNGKEIRRLTGYFHDDDDPSAVSFGGIAARPFIYPSGQLTLRETQTEKDICVLRRQGLDPRAVSAAIGPNWRVALAGNDDGTLTCWDFARIGRFREFYRERPKATEALTRNPNDAEALSILGQWYAFRHKTNWAVELLERARANGATVDSLTLGCCYWELSDDIPPKSGVTRDACLVAARREYAAALAAAKDPNDAFYLRLCLDAVEHAAVRAQGTQQDK